MTKEMRTLLEQAASGDRDAEARLIEDNSGLIWSIVRRYYGRGTEPDDLYQLACVGFIKAVRGFDVSLGNEFSTYAVPKIAGEIRRFLRDDGAVMVSRAVKERAVRVRRLQSDWESRNGRSPTVSELAQAAGLTVEEVAACEQADVSVDSFERELSGGGRVPVQPSSVYRRGAVMSVCVSTNSVSSSRWLAMLLLSSRSPSSRERRI